MHRFRTMKLVTSQIITLETGVNPCPLYSNYVFHFVEYHALALDAKPNIGRLDLHESLCSLLLIYLYFNRVALYSHLPILL